MNYTIHTENQGCHIHLDGSFTFADNSKFREILSALCQEGIHSARLNFMKVDFIDSAALGMLLLLRDAMRERKTEVTLAQAQGQVRKMFDLSKFDRLFTVEQA